jgi:transcriptional regulator with XRE-family HTH domain
MGVFMGMAEKIRILLVKRGNISEAELARRLGMSTTNLYNRLKRDNFTDKDLQRIAEVLDCTFKAGFTLNDTGEEI